MSAPQLDLDIDGMSCASCAARIQKKVSHLDGVSQASVNYATGTAQIDLDPGVGRVADVVQTIEALGYGAVVRQPAAFDAADHASHGAQTALRRRLLVAVPLTLAVVVLGMVPWFHMQSWAPLAGLVLATPVVWWCGWPIHSMALKGLRHRSVGMDTLVSLGSSVAWLWSVYQVLAGGDQVYAEVSAVVITFVLLGRWLEARATDTSVDAVAALSRLQVDAVDVVAEDGTESRVPLSQVRVGDRFLVRPGERVATDGTVVAGSSALDLSLVTGESVPVEVSGGDPVVGGSVNGSGRLVVAATAVGSDTVLARIAELIRQAQHTKAPIERLVDRIAGVFVPVVLGIALLTFLGWTLAGAGLTYAVGAAVAVLVIACPCALGLATPTALVAGTGRGAELGILIRGPQVLEAAQRVDTVLLDKTGTVTTGHMAVVETVGGTPDERRWVAAVESASEHPIGRAVAAAFGGSAGGPVTGFVATPGAGAEGLVAGHHVRIGRTDGTLPDDWQRAADGFSRRGLTPVCAWLDHRPAMVIAVGDTVKPDSRQAVERMRALGLTPVLVTGDREGTARTIAAQVGITEVVPDVTPEGEVAVVRQWQDAGAHVAMVGDGINDAAALAQADLGIAMGSGTDAAREAADITIVNSELSSVVDAVELSRRTWRTIRQNLVWAFGYNVAAIPLAVSGLLNPMIAGAAMAFSSVLVVSNSLRLRGFGRRPRGVGQPA